MKKTLSIIFLSVLLTVWIFAQNQISELSKGMVAHFPLSECYPNVDLVSGVQGTATDTYNCLDRQGSGRRSLSFNGSSDYVTLPAISAFGTGDFSLFLKAVIKTTNDYQYILVGGTGSFAFYIHPTNKLVVQKAPATDLTFSTTVITNGEHTFGYIKSGNVGTYYVDGIANGVITDNQDYTAATTKLSNSAYAFAGSISMCRIWNYALNSVTVGADGLTELQRKSKAEYPIEGVDRGATGVNLVTNGDFANTTTGWTLWHSTLASVAGGHSGNCMQVTLDDSSPGYGYQSIATVIGRRYNFSAWAKKGTATGGEILLGSAAFYDGNRYDSGVIAPADWTQYTNVQTAVATTLFFSGLVNAAGTMLYDDISLVQLGCVLDLNAEGINRQNISTVNAGYWWDATNNIAATVSGATVVIPPASNLGATWFNGTTSKIVYTGMNGLTGITTISAQIHPIALGGFIFDNTKVKLKVNSSGYLSFSRDGSTYVNSGAGSIAINTTYNILITSTAVGVTNMYINNVLSGTANQAAGTPASGTTWNIGTDATNFYSGSMKDLYINGELLDLDRIKLLNDIN